MDYIVFLITLQLPFIYLFWRFFKRYEDRTNTNFRLLTKRINQTNSLFETLRTMSDTNRASLKKTVKSWKRKSTVLKSPCTATISFMKSASNNWKDVQVSVLLHLWPPPLS